VGSDRTQMEKVVNIVQTALGMSPNLTESRIPEVLGDARNAPLRVD
jgi:hypothetical protein